ncbi:MAG: hypothetical protein C0425_00935 [Chlorobiaceae bacterium]|nr:hypothetical protein [Chlorobiaceae bacterium]MBA4308887.1 hypothetical protein [Chlorobiaceae bacterium]
MKKSEQSNNKTNENIAEEIRSIPSLINQGKFQEALERIGSYEKQNPNDKTLQFNKLCFLVDIGFGLKDQNTVKQGLEIGEQNLKNQKDEKYKANIHYNLANGYLSLYGLAERKTDIENIWTS